MLRMNALRHAIIVTSCNYVMTVTMAAAFVDRASRPLNQLLLDVRRERTHLAAIEES